MSTAVLSPSIRAFLDDLAEREELSAAFETEGGQLADVNVERMLAYRHAIWAGLYTDDPDLALWALKLRDAA